MALELQLGRRDARGHADELGEMEDWHLERSSGRRLQLRLPGVERKVAQRARRDHRVRPGFYRLLDRLDELAERHVLAGGDDREPAALDLRRVVDRLAPAGSDDRLQRGGSVGILEAQELRGPEDLAAVERGDLQPLQPLVRDLLQPLITVALGDQPEKMLDLDGAAVPGYADRLQVFVDPLEQAFVVAELPVRLPEVERA